MHIEVVYIQPSRQLHVHFTPCSSVPIVNVEQVNAGCKTTKQ